MWRRWAITAAVAIGGWIAGVYAYTGLLHVFDDGPRPGDVNVGALLLGFIVALATGRVGWVWSARFTNVKESA